MCDSPTGSTSEEKIWKWWEYPCLAKNKSTPTNNISLIELIYMRDSLKEQQIQQDMNQNQSKSKAQDDGQLADMAHLEMCLPYNVRGNKFKKKPSRTTGSILTNSCLASAPLFCCAIRVPRTLSNMPRTPPSPTPPDKTGRKRHPYLIHMCDWVIQKYDMTYWYLRHGTFVCAAMTEKTYAIIHSYAWNNSSICVTWLVHVCNVTHQYVRHDSFVCVPWLLHTCAVTQVYCGMPIWLIDCYAGILCIACVHTHTHTHTHTRAYACVCMYVCVRVCMCVYLCVCMCVCVYPARGYQSSGSSVPIPSSAVPSSWAISARMSKRRFLKRGWRSAVGFSLYTCTHRRTHTHTQQTTHTQHTHAHTHTRTRTHTHTYAHTQKHTHTLPRINRLDNMTHLFCKRDVSYYQAC